MDILQCGRKLCISDDSIFVPKEAPKTDTGTSTNKQRMEPLPAAERKYLPGEKLALALKREKTVNVKSRTKTTNHVNDYLKDLHL